LNANESLFTEHHFDFGIRVVGQSYPNLLALMVTSLIIHVCVTNLHP